MRLTQGTMIMQEMMECLTTNTGKLDVHILDL